MPDPKKAKVVKPKSPSKPKVSNTKPATKLITGFAAKPKAKAIPKLATKPVPKAPEVKAPVAKKARAYARKPKGSFSDLLKIQSQYEEAKKGAKADLRKQFDAHIKEADSLKAQYKSLFNENIESAPKARGVGAKKITGKIAGLKPFSLSEIEDFVEQKKQGKPVKISGRRPKSIARMEDAYRRSEDAKDILKMLNQ
jgi:hypothetical protein